MSQPNDSDLHSPLLDENNNTIVSHNQNNNGGGVTLHGESVDLRHMFPGSMGGNTPQEENVTGEESPTSTTLSLDNSSSNTTPGPSPLDYVRQTIVFLPKQGRSLYYKTRYTVTNFIQSRSSKSSSGGLTPVDNGTASASTNNHSPTSSNNNTTRTRNRTNTNNKKSRNKTITQKSSLFRSQTTPLLLKLLLPPLLLTNHILFYHAQTKPMWNLAYKTDITISATAATFKSKAAADALNLPHHYDFVQKESKVVETFTYMDAIRKLWKGEGLGDAQTVSKVAAALLVVFSGIWPHLKLLLMHFCWFVPFVHGLWLGNSTNNNSGDDEDGMDEEEDGIGTKRCCCARNNNGCKSSQYTQSSSPRTSCSLCCSNGHPHQTQNLRSPFLRTLSTLGKWSLADVLVVCILIAVLHLDWTVNPDEIRSGIERKLPTLLEYAHSKYPDEVKDCAQLLGYTCGRHALVIHFPACLTCQTLIKNAYHHPEWTTSEGKDILDGISLEGGGYAQLRVMGMNGTYYFCGAVMMSILLSLVVDWMDERDRGGVEEDLLDRKRELEFILMPQAEGENDGGLGNELELREEEEPQPPLLNEAFSLDDPSFSQSQTDRNHRHPHPSTASSSSRVGASSYTRLGSTNSPTIPSPTTNCYLLKQALLILLSMSSLPLVCYAVTLPTMQRLVYGGGPTLLHQVLGMIWEKEYSLLSLVKTTGDAGGWDTFLMLTFGLFAVVGPIVRSVCLILHVFLGLPVALLGDCIERQQSRRRSTSMLRRLLYQATSTFRRALLPVIDALGAFCCWEVLIVALVMIQLEISSITDTIYQDDRCQEADPEHGRTCIEVQFNALDNMLVVGVAWVVLIVTSGLAMDLAGDDHQQSSHSSSSVLGGEEEKRYEFGQPIMQRRSNLARDRAWVGSVGKQNGQSNGGAVGNNENAGDDEEEYYSPLQGGGGQNNGLEEIVFV